MVTIDVNKEGLFGGGYRAYSRNANQKHRVDPIAFAVQCTELGAGEIVLNSIDRDGMMQGYDIDLARKLRSAITTPMTVVGGVGSIDDLRALTEDLGPIGAGAGSFFVFNGKYRAVLISYDRP